MARRPNVLWLTTDQHRYDALGCAGNPVVRTPNLDRLAAEGVRFTRSYVVNPVCMPSRATMFTGRYPRVHGSWQVGVPLPEDELTLPALLGQRGYRTGVFGKLHLTNHHQMASDDRPQQIESIHRNKNVPADEVDRFWRGWHGPIYGFETAELALQHGNRCVGGGHYDVWLREHHPEALDLLEPSHALAPLTGALQSWKAAMPAELHYANWIADRTIEYLQQHREGPWFVSCSFPDPHHPMCPPAPYCDMYDPAAMPLTTPNRGELAAMPPHHQLYYEGRVSQVPYAPGGVAGAVAGDYPLRDLPEAHLREMMAHYYGLITLCDDAIGRVLAALDRLGLADDTVVLFNSDHGELMGDHGLVFKGPFHYEPMIRVPTILRWPGGGVPGGRTHDGIFSSVDIVPTLLEALDVPVPEGAQGISALPALRGEDGPRRDWALVEHREWAGGMQTKTLVTDRWKVTYYPGQPFGELFDLAADPREYENLWASPAHREQRDRMLLRLLELLCTTEDPLPPRVDPA